MRLYIAGPMTGLPEFNIPAFNATEIKLQDVGYDTRNPARHGAGEPGLEWADYMRRDIPDLLDCEGVALLPGWKNSRGARLEVHIARTLEMPVKRADDWIYARATRPGTTTGGA